MELLVVVSIIALLISILLPSLRKARQQSKATVCLAQQRTLGQGLAMYAIDNADVMVPGRLPKVDDENWRSPIAGGLKYRPTFLATMGAYVGVPAFDDPQSSKLAIDRFGERGDRQNYSNDVYVCPSVREWTDERNGCYGYNYQFLGNSRLREGGDIYDYKNWPTNYTHVRNPADCVAVADSMGTAASYAVRRAYDNNSREADRYGNEGFNLDPPLVDAEQWRNGEFRQQPSRRCRRRMIGIWGRPSCCGWTLTATAGRSSGWDTGLRPTAWSGSMETTGIFIFRGRMRLGCRTRGRP